MVHDRCTVRHLVRPAGALTCLLKLPDAGVPDYSGSGSAPDATNMGQPLAPCPSLPSSPHPSPTTHPWHTLSLQKLRGQYITAPPLSRLHIYSPHPFLDLSLALLPFSV